MKEAVRRWQEPEEGREGAEAKLSLSQTPSGWRLIENLAMRPPDVGFVQTDLWNGITTTGSTSRLMTYVPVADMPLILYGRLNVSKLFNSTVSFARSL